MKTPRLVTATLLSSVAMTLAACGAGSSSHVVARVTSTTALPSTSTTTMPRTVATPAGSPRAGGTPTTTAPSNALSTQTLDQVAADLGALDNNLNTANSDLNHPQGDS
ncbi:MAG TPA: hypothetical protein VMU64_06785 [Acidimicrobiales bacterium]|nr:hypothetical protein [Acidimicrobiales bacterium]